ncbi:MAG TPA: hypothetical protein HA340_02620 [Candidatus Thalassarchaeaceae archaeon]|nr:MAG TPA: hypothetical protein D7H97_02575 [Candidatus Poseidoniales archaeon]HIH82819.1 hypothetical protein [Candidatus Thalassarchaeaceae archaeon]
MADSLTPSWLVTLGAYMQEESEKQWFWFGVFIVLMVVGAFWVEASLTLPGVGEDPLLGEGETIEDVVWNNEGTAALILVGRGDGTPLHLADSTGLHPIPVGDMIPNSISTSGTGWLIAGDDGSLASSDGTSLSPITLDWGVGEPLDIMAAASNDGESGFIISKHGSQTRLHNFVNGVVSEGSSPPVSSTMMTDIFLSSDEKLVIVIGYDTALGNPTFGPAGEVVIRVDSVMGQAPSLTLLHHGAGGAIHSAGFVNTGDWGDDVEMMLAGGTSTMLLLSDYTIVELSGVGGSTAATIDETGAFWFARGDSNELLSITSDSENVAVHEISNSVVVDAEFGALGGSEVMFYGTGVDGNVGVLSFDPAANHDVSQSLARFGDLIFVIIVVCSIAIVGHMFWVNDFKPW